MDEDSFWRKSPRQTQRILVAQRQIHIRQHNERMAAAWHVAALSRSKRIPKLQTLLHRDPEKPRRAQTWQEQLAIAHQWAALGGGKITYPPKGLQ